MNRTVGLGMAMLVFCLLGTIRAHAQGNTAPQLSPQPDQTIVELTTLSVTNAATDAEQASNTLSYSLVQPPTGATINANGVITWRPNESQGPGTFTIKTLVADNGEPPLTAFNSFTVTVTETNSAPRSPFLGDQSVIKPATLTVTNRFTDFDVPTNTLNYVLREAPTGATIDTSGVITWPSSGANVGDKFTFTTEVTDNGVPPLSATNSFDVTVTDDTHTNSYLGVAIALSGFVQGLTLPQGATNGGFQTVDRDKISTSDVIKAIVDDLGHGTNTYPGARLLFRTADVPVNSGPGFVLRVGDEDIDVSSYLQFATFGGQDVTTERTNGKNTINAVNYTALEFALTTSHLTFDVAGFTTYRSLSIVEKGKVLVQRAVPMTLRAAVAGGGSANGKAVVWKGTVTVANRKIEVRQGH